MSIKMNQTFRMTALAAALFSAYGPALAEDTGISDGPGTSVVLPSNSVAVGAGNWSQDRPHQGQYDGMRDSGANFLLDADISKRNDETGTWLGLKARNLGLDNREIKGTWERQGDIGGSIEYSRISRDQPYTYNTGLQGIGSTTQTVTNITPGRGADVTLGTTRDRVGVNFFKKFGVGLTFNASFKNEEKDGNLPYGGRVTGTSPTANIASFLVNPINSTTRQYEATLSYSRDRLQLSGGYYGSTYDNSNQLLTVGPAGNPSYFSQPLDNQSHQLFLNGGYDFTQTTRGMFRVSYSRATQDNALPTAAIAGLASPLAPTNLDGRVDTTVVDIGVHSRPMPKLTVAANWRYRDYDDKTAVRQVVFGATPEYTTPLSYRTNTGKAEATYQLPQGFSVQGGIDYTTQSRTIQSPIEPLVPETTGLDETTYRVQVRKSMSETVNGSLQYSHSKRDNDGYILPGNVFEDAINPMNIQGRKRDKWRAMVDWSPMDKVNLQFALEDAKDSYDHVGPYGLQDGDFRLYSIDGSFQLNTDWQIHAWYTRDETSANEYTQQNATVRRYNDLSEDGDSFGLGVNGKITSKLKVGVNAEQYRSLTQYRQSLVGGTLAAGLVPPPDISNSMTRIKLFAQYAVQKNADLRLDLIHERWGTNDWTWNMFPPGGGTAAYPLGTTTVDGTTVVQSPQQNTTFLGVRYIYKFK